MKRLICAVITALLLLCGCADTYTVPENALNTPTYCQIDNIVYMDWAANLRRFSNSTPEGMSLCFDPLCTHSKEEYARKCRVPVPL